MLRYVPIIGWSWVFSSIIFLRRKWDEDKEHIDRQLAVLADYPDPVWVSAGWSGVGTETHLDDNFGGEYGSTSVEFSAVPTIAFTLVDAMSCDCFEFMMGTRFLHQIKNESTMKSIEVGLFIEAFEKIIVFTQTRALSYRRYEFYFLSSPTYSLPAHAADCIAS